MTALRRNLISCTRRFRRKIEQVCVLVLTGLGIDGTMSKVEQGETYANKTLDATRIAIHH